MSVLVKKAGILDTIQDRGRFGYRSQGVNPNGPMDTAAVLLLNTLLGNVESAAVIELHFPASEFVFGDAAAFAVGGADLGPTLSDRPIPGWTIQDAAKGDTLRFQKRRCGNRAYLAFSDGLIADNWLGSMSTNVVANIGGKSGRRLQTGDCIPFASPRTYTPGMNMMALGNSLIPKYSQAPSIRFTRGPEFDRLTAISQHVLLHEGFQITKNSDRMGFRLNGPQLHKLDDAELLSSGTTLGTMQLLPDGQIIVLMADHQTTGGYPRIGVIASIDIPLIAQLGPGDELAFDLIDNSVAEELALQFERSLAFLRTGVRVRSGAL